ICLALPFITSKRFFIEVSFRSMSVWRATKEKGVTLMAQTLYRSEQESQVLREVHEGMPVYDWENKKLGTVKYIQFPDENVAVNLTMYITSLDSVPADMRTRLLREGFVQVEGGLFSPDRYITPDQIFDVFPDHLKLRVIRE